MAAQLCGCLSGWGPPHRSWWALRQCHGIVEPSAVVPRAVPAGRPADLRAERRWPGRLPL